MGATSGDVKSPDFGYADGFPEPHARFPRGLGYVVLAVGVVMLVFSLVVSAPE